MSIFQQNYINISNVAVTGGAIFIANNSYDLGGNSGWTINSTTANDYYWVGDGGDWNDGTHWALTSGGPGSGCVPTFQDNVYFDANSFSVTAQTVSISAGVADCKSMDWSGVTNSPTFSVSNDLNIYGSLTFSPNMTVLSNSDYDLNFKSTVSGNTITFADNNWNGDIIFEGSSGEWGLQDSISVINNFRGLSINLSLIHI